MNNYNTRFFAKILLFGEYSILLGSDALSIPFRYFKARLQIINSMTSDLDTAKKSNIQIRAFYNYLKEKESFNNILDLAALHNDLDAGLYFQSMIPQNYGLGSSGALVAAIYHSYYKEKTEDNKLLCSILSEMEAFFHGCSSGIDPTTIYLNQTLIFDSNKKPLPVISPFADFNKNLGIFLIDTDVQCKTNHLVDDFLNTFTNESKPSAKAIELLELNNKCIEKFIEGNRLDFMQELRRLSIFQLENMQQFIPENIRAFWQQGLENNELIMKICGSGGGGYMLAFASDRKQAIEYMKNIQCSFIDVRIN